MDVRLVAFGELEADGRTYAHDVVIERGEIRRRRKGPSKPLRDRYGHTPLTVRERLPWHRPRLVIGTGADGMLPVTRKVLDEGRRRGIEVIVVPTEEACRLLGGVPPGEANAVLHVTC